MVISKEIKEILIIQAQLQNEDIILEIDFDSEKRDTVKIDIFYGSGDSSIYKLINSLKMFDNLIKINPNYINFKHPYFDEENPSFIEANLEDCICGGRYCFEAKKSLKGREILLENIRQKCVYEQAKNTKNLTLFYDYLDLFYKACLNGQDIGISNLQKHFGLKCSEEITKYLEFPNDYLETCVDSSFNPNGVGYSYGETTFNKYLEKDKKNRNLYYLLHSSQILVNGRYFYSISNSDSIQNTICNLLNSPPDFCLRDSYDSSMSFGTIFFIVVAVVIINLTIYLLCRRYISKRIEKRLMNKDFIGEVNNTVSKYNKLNA
jgi:hypothetical protein